LLERHLYAGAIDGRIFYLDFSLPVTTSMAASGLSAFANMLASDKDGLGGNGEYGTLAGHDKYISSLSISIDGNLLLSSSHDGTSKVWDLMSHQVIRTLSVNKGAVTHASIIIKPFRELVSLAQAQREQTEKLPQTIQPFKTFLQRNEHSAYSTGDKNNLLTVSIPVVLPNTKAFFDDLLDEETLDDPDHETVVAPLRANVTLLTGDVAGRLEEKEQFHKEKIAKLRRKLERWKRVNNQLYRLGIDQLLSSDSPAETASANMPAPKRQRTDDQDLEGASGAGPSTTATTDNRPASK